MELRIISTTNPENFIVRFKKQLLVDSDFKIDLTSDIKLFEVASKLFEQDKNLFKIFIEKLHYVPSNILNLCKQTDIVFNQQISVDDDEDTSVIKNFSIIRFRGNPNKFPIQYIYRLMNYYDADTYIELFKKANEKISELKTDFICPEPNFEIEHKDFGSCFGNAYFCVNQINKIYKPDDSDPFKYMLTYYDFERKRIIDNELARRLFKWKKYGKIDETFKLKIDNKFLLAYIYLAFGLEIYTEELRKLLKENPLFVNVFSKFTGPFINLMFKKENNVVQANKDYKTVVQALVKDYKIVSGEELAEILKK